MESGVELIRGNEERIYVSVRLRPLNDKEISSNDVSDWECINNDSIIYKNVGLPALERSMYPNSYTFDRVFRPDCSTREVYEQGAKDVAISVVRGINSTVFAYGQTSSGKTFTMTGITEYAIADIYDYIDQHSERDFILKFSAMEIYNEAVRDLLSADSTPLRLLDDPERGTVVEKLTEEILRDKNHTTELLSICEAQRQTGETLLNEMSSRSHQIIRLTIESSPREFLGRDNANTLAAAVNFVDLAGSERASQALSAGTRLKEGCHINRSLLTLGTVIRKLSKERNGHIPYRDSKLTRILQTSLGGNARTAIICTMSPAHTHVEQSRNTLLFASCANEVTTNATVNVVMSDKALVKHLQKELARLESELRNTQSNFAHPNYSALLREKDAQIEKLEKEVKDLILQRDIAKSQVQELIKMLGDNTRSVSEIGLDHYPVLRVPKSPDSEIREHESSTLTDSQPSDADTRTCSDEHSGSISSDHFARVQYFDENFVHSNVSPRVILSGSDSSEIGSPKGWDEIEKQSNGTSENLCREAHCIETEESSGRGALESNHSSCEDNGTGFPAIKVRVNEDFQDMRSASPPLAKDQGFISSHLYCDNEAKKDQELISASKVEDQESTEEKHFGFLQCLDIAYLENRSLAHDQAKDSFASRLNLARSKSCKASIITVSASPRFTMMESSDDTPSVRISRKDCQSPPESAVDIEIDTSAATNSSADEGNSSTEKTELPSEQDIAMKPVKEIAPRVNEPPKKNVKDVGLDPIEDEHRGLTSWPVEFRNLQRELIELWHACYISLVHRTYFFLLFQGDPMDAIYLEVEVRRMKFLKDKFSRGEKTIVNGRRLTLSSSAKALRQERRMLSKQMMKKFSEEEREKLFVKWGIGLNTKMRREQLAQLVWSETEDIDHIADSAVLVAKLVGFIESGRAPDKEMFGLNFTPRCSTRISTFKRSLASIL